MQTLLGIIVTLLVLCFLIVIHEAAHALAARATGMRVTELFVGMPYGPSVSRRSERSGIRYGATLALLGGYTRISGMSYREDPEISLALAVLNARGTLTGEELAQVLDCQLDEALVVMDALVDLGSAEPIDESGRVLEIRNDASRIRTPRRDADGLTACDSGHDFELPGSTDPGRPYMPSVSPDDFLSQEISHTYAGKGFFARTIVLLAGIASNLLCAVVIVCAFYMIQGVNVVSPAISEVVQDSAAQTAGLVAGDVITSVDGNDVTPSYDALAAGLESHRGKGPFEVVYQHEGEERVATVTLGEDETFGIQYAVERQRLGFVESLRMAWSYAAQTGEAIAKLIQPNHAAEVISQSSGIIGIVAITGEAVQGGVWATLLLAASLSLSLGWLNLLPVPPLDGGKWVIEIVQLILGRQISMRAQMAISLVGISLITVLFIVMLGQDVLRIFTGGF